MFELESSFSSKKNINFTIYTIISNWAKYTPDKVAITAPGRLPLTYYRLYKQIKKIINELNKLGIVRNDRVAIVLPNGPDMAVTFLAVSTVATCAPLNPNYKTKEFDFFLLDLKAKALIVQSGLTSPAKSIAEKYGICVIHLSPMSEAGIYNLISNKHVNLTTQELAKSDDVALVLHTSGTTSRPKLVPLTHNNLCTSADNIRETLKLKSNDCCLNIMPLFHIHGLIGATLSTMLAGATIACTPGFHAPKFFEWMNNFLPTWYTAVPTMHQAILRRTEENMEIIKHSKLRFIRSSSSALPPQVMIDLENIFNVPVIESYGMTEAAHQMASNPLPPGKRKTGSVGIASGPEIAIMNDKNNLVSRGEIGEIVVRGLNVTKGYENNPDANKMAFINSWFKTGDQGYFDNDNYLTITDRIKEIINRGGEKISPREIDETLLNHPNILQAVSFAIPHPKLGEDIAAVVVLQDNESVTEWEIQKFLSSRLADFKIPSHILILDEIPKGSTGKIQRIGLAKKLNQLGVFDVSNNNLEYKGPITALEKKIVKIWSQVLKINKIGINDNFFQLGGDSIQGGLIISLICEAMQLDQIPLAIFLHAPTIEKMAQLISQEDFSVPSASLVAIQSNGDKPKIYLVHPCDGDVIIFASLARHLGPKQPLYALRAQGLDGKTSPYVKVEEMASHYIKEIQATQPEGPYILGGAGVGGIIAFEMTQQLLSQGKTVSLLFLIDTVVDTIFSSINPSSIVKNFRFYLRCIVHYLRKRQFLKIYIFVTDIVFPKLGRRRRMVAMGVTQYKVFEEIQKAANSYIPNIYPGRIVLIIPKEREGFSSDPRTRINSLLKYATGLFNAHVVQGEHLEIFKEPFVPYLAQKLKMYL